MDMKEIKALKVGDKVIHEFNGKEFTVMEMDDFHITFWLKPMDGDAFMVTVANMLCVFKKKERG